MSTSRNMLRMAAVMVAAVVAGLLAVQGTWALWNVSVSSGAQSVQAADFEVRLNGQQTLVDGSAVAVSLGDVGALVPGAVVHKALNVTAPTNASADFTVAATVGPARLVDVTAPALGEYLVVEFGVAPAGGVCADVSVWGKTATADIAKGGATGFCVRIHMLDDAPAALRGATATITLPVGVNQK